MRNIILILILTIINQKGIFADMIINNSVWNNTSILVPLSVASVVYLTDDSSNNLSDDASHFIIPS